MEGEIARTSEAGRFVLRGCTTLCLWILLLTPLKCQICPLRSVQMLLFFITYGLVQTPLSCLSLISLSLIQSVFFLSGCCLQEHPIFYTSACLPVGSSASCFCSWCSGMNHQVLGKPYSSTVNVMPVKKVMQQTYNKSSVFTWKKDLLEL